MFCSNMEKLKAFKDQFVKYDIMDAVIATEYCDRMAAHTANK